MNQRRILSSSLSAQVIKYLVERGHTQGGIARMLGVSPGFVSLVASRERCLTLDHLERISDRLDVPLGAILLAVTPRPKHAKPSLKRLFDATEAVIQMCDKARAMIENPAPKRASKRSA